MDFTLSKEQLIIQNVAKEFVEKYLDPVAEQIDRENLIPESIIKGMAELDFFALPYEEEYGGAGAGYDGYVLVLEQIAKASKAAAAIIGAHTLGLGAIKNFALPETKKKYLIPCCKGEWIGSFAFTEPATGSDPKQITTTAVKEGNEFIINGTKRFITNAIYKGPMVVFARDAVSGKPTGFIVDKFCPGYSVSEPWNKLGTKGQRLVDVYFKDVKVPEENLLGELGQGYPILQYGISFGKLGISARGLGGLNAALEDSVKYAKQKVHRDGFISKFPTIQTKIADIAMMLEASRWMTYRLSCMANNVKDQAEFVRNAAMTKTFVSEMGVQAARLAVEVHGSYGLMEDYRVARCYRDAIFGPMTEGVSDMQKIIIAGFLLRD